MTAPPPHLNGERLIQSARTNTSASKPDRESGAAGLVGLTALQGAQVDDVRQAARIGAGGVDVVVLDLLRARRRQAGHRVHPAPRPIVSEHLVAVPEQRRRRVPALELSL